MPAYSREVYTAGRHAGHTAGRVYTLVACRAYSRVYTLGSMPGIQQGDSAQRCVRHAGETLRREVSGMQERLCAERCPLDGRMHLCAERCPLDGRMHLCADRVVPVREDAPLRRQGGCCTGRCTSAQTGCGACTEDAPLRRQGVVCARMLLCADTVLYVHGCSSAQTPLRLCGSAAPLRRLLTDGR